MSLPPSFLASFNLILIELLCSLRRTQRRNKSRSTFLSSSLTSWLVWLPSAGSCNCTPTSVLNHQCSVIKLKTGLFTPGCPGSWLVRDGWKTKVFMISCQRHKTLSHGGLGAGKFYLIYASIPPRPQQSLPLLPSYTLLFHCHLLLKIFPKREIWQNFLSCYIFD